MAARRPPLGLRRRGPRLTARRHHRRLAGLAALSLLLAGCAGLSKQEEARLSVHQQNSQDFYQRGYYLQALHQADMALQLDADLVGMRLLKGFCLTKLGRLREDPAVVEQALAIFDDLVSGAGQDDYRSWLGAGQAQLARALLHDAQIARIERRLRSDFLSADGRREEETALAAERAARERRLGQAERHLRRAREVVDQGEDPYVLIELALALNSRGGHDDEVIALSAEAIGQLQESTRLARNTLQKSGNLHARGKLALQRRIDENLEKEQKLRDIVLTIQFNRGAWQACLSELAALDERQLLSADQVLLRAGVHEQIGMLSEAMADLEFWLRLRARTSHEYDDVTAQVYTRLDELRSRLAGPAP